MSVKRLEKHREEETSEKEEPEEQKQKGTRAGRTRRTKHKNKTNKSRRSKENKKVRMTERMIMRVTVLIKKKKKRRNEQGRLINKNPLIRVNYISLLVKKPPIFSLKLTYSDSLLIESNIPEREI